MKIVGYPFLLAAAILSFSSRAELPSQSFEDFLNQPSEIQDRDLREVAPPPFEDGRNERVVPVHVQNENIDIQINADDREAVATSRLSFKALYDGYPMIDLVPNPTAVSLDGESLDPSLYSEIPLPGEAGMIRVLPRPVRDGETHTLQVSYILEKGLVTYQNGGADFRFHMSDLESRRFMERYAPSNFEFDQFPRSVHLKVESLVPHLLFTNGTFEEGSTEGAREWKIQFPSHFTTSSLYLHVSNLKFDWQTRNYQGQKATFPVTIYTEGNLLEESFTAAFKILKRHEETYGPYGHPSLTINITSRHGGGMEYSGATETSLGALQHELCHSWFARGVMPANGAAGWIDEAICSWDNNGNHYPDPPEPSKPELSWRNPYLRLTNKHAYGNGSKLVGYLDGVFAGTRAQSMRMALVHFFAERDHQVYTTKDFQTYLEKESGLDLGDLFNKVVYGSGSESWPPLEDSTEIPPLKVQDE